MKKFVSLLLAMMMVIAMAAGAMAEENPKTYTLTLKGAYAGHTYSAYQIFAGDISAPDANDTVDGTSNILSNITWGSSVNTKAEGFNLGEAAAVAETLIDAADALAFADQIIPYLGTHAGSATVAEGATSCTITGLEAGYYLIMTTAANSTGAYTTYMMEVIENSTATVKADAPEVEKKVDDVNDSDTSEDATKWEDSADYDIGDTMNFQLTATLPSNYESFKSYKLVFKDTMENMEQVTIKSVYLTDAAGKKVGNDFAASDYTLVTADNGFTVTFADLKESSLKDQIKNGYKVVVEYTAVLSADANIGAAGNKNTVKLEYSNNPNWEYDAEKPDEKEPTGKTPDDTVIVFTFETIVNKVDQDKKPLTGAGFKLEKFVASENGTENYKNVAGNWVAEDEATVTEGTKFSFKGLDAGEYRLTETVTPAGYNTIDPIYFTIEATHDEKADAPKLNTLVVKDAQGNEIKSFTVTIEKGQVATDVVNKQGATLPETGGMGTTMMYIGGGLLVAFAVIMLATKRRMNAAE